MHQSAERLVVVRRTAGKGVGHISGGGLGGLVVPDAGRLVRDRPPPLIEQGATFEVQLRSPV